MSYVEGGGLNLEDILSDLEVPESLQFFNATPAGTMAKQDDPYALPEDGSLDWESMGNVAAPRDGRDDSPTANRTGELGFVPGAATGEETPGDGSLLASLVKAGGNVSGLIKNNPELSQMALSGLAGAFKDKSAKEVAGAQIDYLKERQAALNGSVTNYGNKLKKG